MYPGDPSADPANVWNCRCCLTYKVVGFRGINGKTVMVDEGEEKALENRGNTLTNSGESVKIKAGSDTVEENNDVISAQSSINKKKAEEIIQKGISLEKPIFANGSFGEYAKYIPPEEGFYDVALHGTPKTVEFFGTKIDDNMLAQIIKGRSDYNGSAIRLLSCSTGAEEEAEECFAKRLAKRLGVKVKAPDKTLWVFKPEKDGNSKFSIGTTWYSNDGDFKLFEP